MGGSCYLSPQVLVARPSSKIRLEEPPQKRSLATVLKEQRALSIRDAVEIALDVCTELSHAHANGVVHGDLGLHRVRTRWPHSPGSSVELFALDEGGEDSVFMVQGAAAFVLAAPEQREGRIVDARADVWAL